MTVVEAPSKRTSPACQNEGTDLTQPKTERRANWQPSALAKKSANVGQSRKSHFASWLVRRASSSTELGGTVAKLWKHGENGTGKNWKFVPICPIFLRFSSRFQALRASHRHAAGVRPRACPERHTRFHLRQPLLRVGLAGGEATGCEVDPQGGDPLGAGGHHLVQLLLFL